MQEKIFDIKTIVESLFLTKNAPINKRLIYDKAPLGGLSNKWTKFIFVLLPIVMYFAIFNPVSFKYLGIAQAIVAYIILLVMAMQIVMGMAYFNNKKIIKTITPSWEHYFTNVDLKMILAGGVTPYVDFKKHYTSTLDRNLSNDELHENLQEAFAKMEEENKDLIDAINRDRAKQAQK